MSNKYICVFVEVDCHVCHMYDAMPYFALCMILCHFLYCENVSIMMWFSVLILVNTTEVSRVQAYTEDVQVNVHSFGCARW